MKWKHAATCVLAPALAALGGCPISTEDGPTTQLLGIAGNQAYFEHYEEWSGFVTLPSTIWELDLDSGEAEQIQTARVQYDLQVAGDYYVAERPTDDNLGSRIVAVQISTGDEIIVLERDVQLGGRYGRAFALCATRVVAITDDGLLVYDLQTRQVEQTIDVDDELVEIYAASDEWALVVHDAAYSDNELLVNLQTGEVEPIPELPDEYHGLFFEAAFGADSMFTASFREDGAGEARAVHTLHIPTMTWEMLVDYGESAAPWYATPLTYVRGADETHVLAEYIDRLRETRIELIEIGSGESVLIDRTEGLWGPQYCPQLHANRVYWTDETLGVLVIYDVSTAQRETVPLPVLD